MARYLIHDPETGTFLSGRFIGDSIPATPNDPSLGWYEDPHKTPGTGYADPRFAATRLRGLIEAETVPAHCVIVEIVTTTPVVEVEPYTKVEAAEYLSIHGRGTGVIYDYSTNPPTVTHHQ